MSTVSTEKLRVSIGKHVSLFFIHIFVNIFNFLSKKFILSLSLLLVMITLIGAVATTKTLSRKEGIDHFNSGLFVKLILQSEINSQKTKIGEHTPQVNQINHFPASPGYTLILLNMALLDNSLRDALLCNHLKRPCPPEASFMTLAVFQLGVAILGLLCAFFAAYILSGSKQVAFGCLILMFTFSRIGDNAGLIRADIWLPSLTMLIILLLALIYHYSSFIAAGLLGIAGAFAGLFLPTYCFILPIVILAILLKKWRRNEFRKRILLSTFIICTACITFYIADNQLKIVPFSLYFEPSVRMLSERVAFNKIENFEQWFAGLIVPMSHRISELFFSNDTIHLYGPWIPGTFVHQGATEIYPKAIADATAPPYAWLTLIETYVFKDLSRYFIATPVALSRGLWIENTMLAVIGILHLREAWNYQKYDGGRGITVFALLPILLILLINIIITANHHFYNPGLIFIFCYSISIVQIRH